MRRAAAASLIAAASVLGLAACDGPMDISLFSEPQDEDDVVPSERRVDNADPEPADPD